MNALDNDKTDRMVICVTGLDHGVHDRVFWYILEIPWISIYGVNTLVHIYVYVSCEK